MLEWILILTFFPGMRDGGVAIEHIPAFKSERQCMTAALAWERQWQDLKINARAACVPRGPDL